MERVNSVAAQFEDLPLLKLLSGEGRALAERSAVPVSFSFGEVIAREGEPADAVHLIVSGRVRVVRRGGDGEEAALGFLHPGESVGEVELLDDALRPATLRASGTVSALRLDRSAFDALWRIDPEMRAWVELRRQHERIRRFFPEFPACAQLPADAVAAVLSAELQSLVVETGEIVIRQGELPRGLFLVEDGHLRMLREESGRGRFIRCVGPGEVLGEMALFERRPFEMTVDSSSTSRLLSLTEGTYRQLLNVVPGLRAQTEARVAGRNVSRLAHRSAPTLAVPVEPVGDEPAPDALAGANETEDRLEAHSEPFAVDGHFIKQRRRIRRFRHVSQIDETDCGAACLAMVCRHFGRVVSLARIRRLVHAAVDGTALRDLCHAATELGLAARAVKVSWRHLPRMPLPAIVHWEGNHWVVLVDVAVSQVLVDDPAAGSQRFDIETFRRKWTGYAALFDYTEAFERAANDKSDLGWLWQFVKPHGGLILRALGLAAVISGLQMLLPVFTQVVVDRVVVDRDVALLNLLILAMALVMVVTILATGIQRYLLAFVAVRVDAATLDFLVRRLLALPLTYFSSRRTGDLQRRLEGVRQLRDVLLQHGVTAMTSAVQLAAMLALMVVYSRMLALIFLGAVPVYALLMLVSARVLRPIYGRLEEAFGKYHSHQIDAIKGIETVKALGAESAFRDVMLDQFQHVARRLFRADFTALAYDGGIQSVTFMSMVIFLWMGAHQVMAGRLTIGGLAALSTLVAMTNAPIAMLLGIWDQVQRSAVLVNRLNDVFEQEPEQGADRSRLRPVRHLEGHISFRNLGFRYGGLDASPILEGITFDITPGQRVAIVGRSGSGKTTLAKCMVGLLQPTDGTILFDGVDLQTLNYRDVRRRIGFVLQENHLFADTIARNIAFGEEPDMERVRSSAAIADAREFIERLPLGYETRIGETGIALSGGQRQRIAIARAIYRRPPILALDEATSSLDAESERMVQHNLGALLQGRTSVVIAHRLSTIQNADVILVLEKGRLVEHGTHQELLARQGLYYHLSNQQLAFAGT